MYLQKLVIAPFQTFSPVRGSSFQSASGGRADRCRASRSGANPRRDFPAPRPPSGSLAFTAWRQTVLATVCSPSRARFTSRPAARNSSTRSSTNRRASAAFTNGGSASSRNVRSPNSLKPTPSRVSAASCLAQKLRVARRQFDGFRQQQFLRRRGFVLSPAGSSSARTKSARAPRAGPAARVRGRIPARRKACR